MQMEMRINVGCLYITEPRVDNAMGFGLCMFVSWWALAFVIVLLNYEHVNVFMHINV